MTTPVRLDGEYRARAWRRLGTKDFDVLVVGGGVTGAGVALDAATRGLSTALVEQRDFGSGTSSRSSKLFHGGLRYLEQMNFDLVREALRERELMLGRIAPHLVRPVSFLYPLKGRGWERPYVTAGLALYDTIGGARSVPRHRQLTRTGALKLAPALRPDALTGGLLYYDAQADDARHTLTTVRTAAAYGATVLSSARVVGLQRAGERVVGAIVEAVAWGERTQVSASAVRNPTPQRIGFGQRRMLLFGFAGGIPPDHRRDSREEHDDADPCPDNVFSRRKVPHQGFIGPVVREGNRIVRSIRGSRPRGPEEESREPAEPCFIR